MSKLVLLFVGVVIKSKTRKFTRCFGIMIIKGTSQQHWTVFNQHHNIESTNCYSIIIFHWLVQWAQFDCPFISVWTAHDDHRTQHSSVLNCQCSCPYKKLYTFRRGPGLILPCNQVKRSIIQFWSALLFHDWLIFRLFNFNINTILDQCHGIRVWNWNNFS